MTGKKNNFHYYLIPLLSLSLFVSLFLSHFLTSYSLFIRKLLPWFIYALFALGFFWLYFHPIHLPETSIHQTPKSSFLLHCRLLVFHLPLSLKVHQDKTVSLWIYYFRSFFFSSFTNKESEILFLSTEKVNAINETPCDYSDSKWVPLWLEPSLLVIEASQKLSQGLTEQIFSLRGCLETLGDVWQLE